MKATALAKKAQTYEREFLDFIHEVEEKPYSRSIHQLRIITRRLRAALWLYEHSANPKDFSSLREDLHKLGSRLGINRELDVLIKDSRTYHFNNEKIIKTKSLEYNKLKQRLRKPSFKKAQKKLHSFVLALRSASLPVQKDMEALIKKSLWKWPETLPTKKKDLHLIRIQTKKMIYRLELLDVESPALKRLQKNLGRIHDLEELEKNQGTNRHLKSDLKELLKKAQRDFQKCKKQ